jgi:cell division septation protein DedD
MAGDKPVKKRRWRYQIDLGPLSMMLWCLFIFFFLTWIFVLGIFVGRGFLPGKISDLSNLKGEITKLQEPVETKETMNSNPSGETEPELAFYDKLTTKKDEARNDLQTAAPAEINKAPAPIRETIPLQPTASDKKNITGTAVSTPTSGSSRYTIQVASIAELASAEKTVKHLVEKGFDAYYYAVKVKGKTYYRIRCGKFSDKEEALKYSLKLKEKTGLKGYVTGNE